VGPGASVPGSGGALVVVDCVRSLALWWSSYQPDLIFIRSLQHKLLTPDRGRPAPRSRGKMLIFHSRNRKISLSCGRHFHCNGFLACPCCAERVLHLFPESPSVPALSNNKQSLAFLDSKLMSAGLAYSLREQPP